MIRLLVCLECVLLVLVAVDRLVVARSSADVPLAATAAPVARAAADSASAPAGPSRAEDASLAERPLLRMAFRDRAMPPDERIAIAHDLLGAGAISALSADLAASQSDNEGGAVAETRSARAQNAAAWESAPHAAPEVAGAHGDSMQSDGTRAGDAASAGVMRARITAAQRLLTQLGYQTGPADGTLGSRTGQAIRAYQQRSGERVDGQFSEQLLEHLQRDARLLASAGRGVAQTRGRGQPSATEGGSGGPGIIASILVGYQRLIGHHFDSVHQPTELTTYCRSQPDSWIYDDGRRSLLFCGGIVGSSRKG